MTHIIIRRTALLVGALVLFGVMHAAFAQAATRVTLCDPATPANAICVSWEAPAVNVDGSPTVLALTYRVERLTQTINPTWITVETTSNTRSYVKGLAPGTYNFRVFAIAGGMESAPSNTATKAVIAPTPSAVVITVASR